MENNNAAITEKATEKVITDSSIIFNKKWTELEFKHYENGKISIEIDEFERQGIMLEEKDFLKLFNWLKEYCE